MIAACAPHLAPLITFMLYTGCRVGEALNLNWREVNLQKARVSFLDTKNGERRGVPLHPRALAAIANLSHHVGSVFRRPDKQPYEPKDKAGGQDQDGLQRRLPAGRNSRFSPPRLPPHLGDLALFSQP